MDVLPYLGYEPQFTEENKDKISVNVPNIIGLTPQEALVKLDNLGLKINPKGKGEKITNQIPAAGTKLHKGNVVIAYTENEEAKGNAIVPEVVGMNYTNAKSAITSTGLSMELDAANSGTIPNDYIAVSQSPAAGSEVAAGTKIYVKFVKREEN